MELKILDYDFSVCKLDKSQSFVGGDFCFTARTDEEFSLVCKTEDVPPDTVSREDGWKGFRIEGTLDFSLIGIISKISEVLADNKIGIFVVSTYNTDYVFVKEQNFEKTIVLLKDKGYKTV